MVNLPNLKQKAIYPSEIWRLRNQNISFSSAKSETSNHEGGDFKLENKIKQIKSITPKGKKDVDMWKRTIRATPSVSKVLSHGRKLLQMDDDSFIRITRSENEIVKWRALLPHNAYLSVSTPYVQSFSGERLSDSLLELGKGCDELRLLYWQKVREGIPMESIRYDNIQIQ